MQKRIDMNEKEAILEEQYREHCELMERLGWRLLGDDEITEWGDFAPFINMEGGQFMPAAHRGTKVSDTKKIWGNIWRSKKKQSATK